MKKILIFASIAASLWSCETIVDIELPEHKPVLVVNGIMNPDSVLTIKITHSRSSLDNGEIKPIENAAVALYLPGGQYLGNLDHVGDGHYQEASGSFVPSVGTQYIIEAVAPGYDKVSATDAVPIKVPIVSYTVKDSALQPADSEMMAQLDIVINDPPGRNYYAIELMMIDTTMSDTMFMPYKIYLQPLNHESSTEEHAYSGILVNDEFFDGKTYTISLLFGSGNLGYMYYSSPYKLRLNFKTLSRDLYLYEKTFYLNYINSGNPFAEPVRVHSNVNGGFGIFGAYSEQTVMID
jgi:hypothetical protein